MAKTPERKKREHTAREAAALLGCTPRHVRNLTAQERKEWLKEQRARRRRAYLLRQRGWSWKAIGEALGVSDKGAHYLGKTHEQELKAKRAAREAKKAEKPPPETFTG
jgi:hypothetical protein